MIKKNAVSHKGVILKIEQGKYFAKLDPEDACTTCHIKGACTAANVQDKVIEVFSEEKFSIGDKVLVDMEESLGLLAVFFTFFLPFFLTAVIILSFYNLLQNELLTALAGLVVLIPYYLILYLFRNKLAKKFIFHAKAVPNY